jgi:hypothetical protein
MMMNGLTKEEDMETAIKRVKRVVGYAAHARINYELRDAGYIRRMPIREPYAYSPTHRVYEYKGKHVIVCETSHRTYDLFQVPTGITIFKYEKEALADFVKHGGLKGIEVPS